METMEVRIQRLLMDASGKDEPGGTKEPERRQSSKQLTYKKKLLLPGTSKTHPLQVAEPDLGGEGFRVLLFNDDSHQIVEVVLQLIKALKCSAEDALQITMRAHTKGQAVVTITSRKEASRIADVLREIALEVRVDKI
jgi:ATP-dependent Clp protease adaptor protein ClpS